MAKCFSSNKAGARYILITNYTVLARKVVITNTVCCTIAL